MKKTFVDLAPTTEQLKRINELAGGELEATDVAVIPLLIIDSNPTVFDTIPDQTWFDQALKDINGDEGVSMQLNHVTDELPSGRLFHAELEVHEGLTVLSALLYTRDADFVDKYLSGEVKAVSAGLCSSWYKCSICGNEWLSEECFAYSEDKGQKMHWPGKKFGDSICYLFYMVEEGDKALREVSPVYCGASKGILLTDKKAKTYIKKLSASVDECLTQEDDGSSHIDKKTLTKSAKKFRAKTLTLAFPQPGIEEEGEGISNIEHGISNEEGKDASDGSDSSVEITNLKSEITNHKSEIASLQSDLGVKTQNLASLQSDYDALAILKTNLEKNLVELEKKIDAALAGAPDYSKELSLDDKLVCLADYCSLALGLRDDVVSRIRTLAIKVDGNDARSYEAFDLELNPRKLSLEFDALENRFAAENKIEPITKLSKKQKAETRIKKRLGVDPPDSVYKI